MVWICPYCSSENTEENTICCVCGSERPTKTSSPGDGADGGGVSIVFSDFAAFVESIKNLFRPKASRSRPAEPAHPAPEPARPDPEPTRPDPEPTRGPIAGGGSGPDFAEPWPEHRIRFDIDAIQRMGYIRSERTVMGGVNGYTFYKGDGTNRFLRGDMVTRVQMARKI